MGLYVGFEPSNYYQESIYMMRKVVFILFAKVNFGRQVSPAGRTLVLLILTCINLAVHLIASPFDNRAYFGLDRLETYCGFTLIALLAGRLGLSIFDTSSSNFSFDSCPDPDDQYSSAVVRLVYAP